jgi:ribonuclease-3
MLEVPHGKHAKSELNEYAQKTRQPLESSVSKSGPDHQPIFVAHLAIAGIKAEGSGRSSRDAETAAARRILQQLRDSDKLT